MLETTSVNDARFRTFYDRYLAPLVPELKAQRWRCIAQTLIGWALLLGVSEVVRHWLLQATIPHERGMRLVGFTLFWFFVMPVGAVVAYLLPKQSYVKAYKAALTTRIVEKMLPGISYGPEQGVDRHAFEASHHFLELWNQFESEDRVTGKVAGCPFVFGDLAIKREVHHYNWKGQRHRHDRSIFRGVFITVSLPEAVAGEVFVLPHLGGSVMDLWEKLCVRLVTTSGVRPDRVDLADPAFDDHFVVHATDETAARALLGAPQRARLIALTARAPDLRISWIGPTLYISYPHAGNPFDPAYMRPSTPYEEAQTLASQFLFALDVIRALAPGDAVVDEAG